MKSWHTALIGLGVSLVMIVLTLPITLYIAIDKPTNDLKPASLGVFAFWIAAVVIGSVGGALVTKQLGSVDRDAIDRRHAERYQRPRR